MKKIASMSLSFFCLCYAFSQSPQSEEEIKNLEQMEVKAVQEKDTITLKKLWDKEYVVNNPDNKVVLAVPNSVFRPVLNKPRTFFTREVEHISIRGNIAFSMGNETIIPGGDLPKAGQIVKRRYTNIWMNVDGSWKLVARHANEICSPN
ncbi:MAG: nuclear transport factor 2 family protein [Saprospiraceae bacterium]